MVQQLSRSHQGTGHILNPTLQPWQGHPGMQTLSTAHQGMQTLSTAQTDALFLSSLGLDGFSAQNDMPFNSGASMGPSANPFSGTLQQYGSNNDFDAF
jgi:hypothetical protein